VKLRFLQKSGLLFLVAAWMAVGHRSGASDTIYLDPDAKPTSPPATISAVISEEQSERFCPAQLLPNGVLLLARPCALDDRIGNARLWSRDAHSISLHKEDGLPLVRFEERGHRVYQTRGLMPPQLVLTLLPEVSQPSGQ
jgi:hypothetical protein